MEPSTLSHARTGLPIILISAVVQGWSLYALHIAVIGKHWPATEPAWLLALYAICIAVPLSAQFLVEHARLPLTWLAIALLGLAFGYFGWHQGSAIVGPTWETQGDPVPFALPVVLGVLWLMVLPFIQCRLSSGRWWPTYDRLFAVTWRNKLMLAEAVLFTGLFWVLLMLWQSLFHMLGIDFFRELFDEPVFIYPVTALAFGLALHLIGSVERFTAVVLEQLLNVLKWLAVVAGLILALFTVALVFKLPGLMSSGERAIGAAWLLWLVAVIVLLVNAAYRDGSVDEPYPKWLAFALRIVMPCTIVVALTASYSLIVRVSAYGLTGERVWALIVAAAALIYAVGYAAAAFGRGRWMNGIARVNVATALALIVTIALTLTPLLSPQRLSASSQYRLALSRPIDSSDEHRSPLYYLRFQAGEYGRAKLRELAARADFAGAKDARHLLARTRRSEPPTVEDLDRSLARLPIFPAGRSLAPELVAAIKTRAPAAALAPMQEGRAGLYVDLDDDGKEEFVLLGASQALAYGQTEGGGWQWLGDATPDQPRQFDQALHHALESGQVSVHVPRLKTLQIGAQSFRFRESK